MKKIFAISFFSFTFVFLSIPLISYAIQTNMPTYYPSPNSTFTKIHLMNSANGPNENTSGSAFCLQTSNNPPLYDPTPKGDIYINAGIIFADPITGYLEICKSDGSVASYPGSCFNRFSSSIPATPCPTNYQIVNSQTFSMTHSSKNIESWTCCFTGQGSSAANFSKSGCFSIYSPSNSLPDVCTSSTNGDPNAYDIGCEAIYSSSDMTNPVYKRNCCFNMIPNPVSGQSPLPLGQPSACCPSICPSPKTCQFTAGHSSPGTCQ